MKTEAIVAAAGIGKRIKTKTRKPYLNIRGKPILLYTLLALNSSREIDRITVVVRRADRGKCLGLIKKYNVKKVKAVIAGGRERRDSVHNGLKALEADTDLVLIHDGVRPFIDRGIIRRSVECAKKSGACVVGVPLKATIKKVKTKKVKLKSVEGTVDRRTLWEIQTPQVFKKALILEAYKRFNRAPATDDSMLVEKLGARVRVVMGSYRNIKITTPEDLAIAEALIRCA